MGLSKANKPSKALVLMALLTQEAGLGPGIRWEAFNKQLRRRLPTLLIPHLVSKFSLSGPKWH